MQNLVTPSRLTLLVLLLSLLLLSNACREILSEEGSTSAINDFESLKAAFADPTSDYRTAPLWVWNEDLSEEEIDFQLENLHQQGIGGVFIHPRMGLTIPYLGKKYEAMTAYTLKKAKTLDMKVWIYDEFHCPSGYAGGLVGDTMPLSCNQPQGLRLIHHDTLMLDTAKTYWRIDMKQADSLIEITDEAIGYNGKVGDFYVYELVHAWPEIRLGDHAYVDLLIPDVTQVFMDITMPPYERALSQEFGKAVPGVFTDEPNIRPPGKDALRYTPGLFKMFNDRWGYRLENQLVSLFEDQGNYQQVRYHYYKLMLELMVDRWCKPWQAYCKKHNLKWTGHYWEHGWPSPAHNPDNMAMYAYHTMPGIDMLGNTRKARPDQFGNVRAVKEAASVANQMGYNRVLSETYGAAGYDLGFEDMKRNGDWQAVLGVNFQNQHLSFISIRGARKYDFPQTFSYHSAWWSHYHLLADYYARLQVALSAGEQINKVLLIEPTTTSWFYYHPPTGVTGYPKDKVKALHKLNQLKVQFEGFLDQAEAMQLEYDLASEHVIEFHGDVDDDELLINRRAYELVILPPGLENLDKRTFELLNTYLENGGKVLSFSGLPSYIEGSESDDAQAWKQYANENFFEADSLDNKLAKKHWQAENFKIIRRADQSGKLFHQRRQLSDGQILFLFNDSKTDYAAGDVSIEGRSVWQLDPFTGDIKPYPATYDKKQASLSFYLPPVGSLLLYVYEDERADDMPAYTAQRKEIGQIVDSLSVERLAPNVLTLDYADVTLNGQTTRDWYYHWACDSIFKAHGFTQNPWSWAIQKRDNLISRDTFPKESGFDAVYRFDVAEGVNTESLKAVTEFPELWQVYINGKAVEAQEDKHWLDRAYGVYDIGKHVRVGRNALKISCHPMRVQAELGVVFITGDFHLESAKRGWRIAPPDSLTLGSWHKQGLPFYGDSVRYSKSLKINKANKQYYVKLPRWQGSVARVLVNGQSAGLIAFPPYELEVSDYLHDGENKVEVVVYATPRNVLGPFHNNPLHGFVSPFSFHYAPETMPEGKSYELYPYGLFQDFQLIEALDVMQ